MSLIVGQHYRGDLKQKPKQWGSVSMVSAAMRDNADRIYNIDYEKIILYAPFWENAGLPRDYISNNSFVLLPTAGSGEVSWGGDGCLLGRYSYLRSEDIYEVDVPFSCVIKINQENDFNSQDSSCLCSNTDGSDGWWSWQDSSDSGIRFGTNHGKIQYGTPNAGEHTIVLVQHSATNAQIFLDGNLVGQGNNGWERSDNSCFYIEEGAYFNKNKLTGYTWKQVIYIGAALSASQASLFSENSYGLIHPIVRRFHSIPDVDVLFAINDISQAQTVQSQSLSHITEIDIAGVSQSQVSSAISLNQLHDLTIETLSQGQSISTSALLQLTELTIDALNHGQVVESPVLDQLNTLSVDAVLQGQATNDLTLAQKIELTVADITQLQDIDVVSLTLAGVLTIHSILQSQGLSSIALDQQVEIAIHGIAQGQTIGATGLSQLQSLLITDIAQVHSIDIVTMEIPGALVINSILQDQSISQPTMAQTHGLLTVASIGQGQSVSVAALDQVHTLAVNSIDQSQGFSSPALDQLIQLGINSVSQGQVIDSQSFFQVLQLSIDNVLQSQITELLTVSQISDLIIDNVNQGIVIDGITFSIAQGRVTVTITTRQPEVNFGTR